MDPVYDFIHDYSTLLGKVVTDIRAGLLPSPCMVPSYEECWGEKKNKFYTQTHTY